MVGIRKIRQFGILVLPEAQARLLKHFESRYDRYLHISFLQTLKYSHRHPLTLQDLFFEVSLSYPLLRTPIPLNHLPMRVKVLAIQLMFIN